MIGIIDYGAGNTRSIMNSLDRIDASYLLTNDMKTLSACDKIVLPGVGHAKQAMNALNDKGLVNMIKQYKRPLLGICLGMQLLCAHSEEGDISCLGITDDIVRRFPSNVGKIPAIGWNTMKLKDNKLTKHITNNEHMYFTHSYYVEQSSTTIISVEYGITYAAALQSDNFYGVQFHPEKSSKNGLQLLKNFIEL